MSNQVYSNSQEQYPVNTDFIGANTINATNTFSQSLGCNTLFINNPPLDNTVTDILVWDSNTSSVKYNDSIGTSTVTNGNTLGAGLPVFQNKTGSLLNFNSINANGSQGFVLTPPTAGEIGINNIFLDQSVKTNSAPSFLGPLHLGGTLQDGAIILSTTAASTSTIRCGAVSQIPMEVVAANGDIFTLHDNGLSEDFVTTFAPQDLLEKHLNDKFGSGSYFYSNTGANRLLKFDCSGGGVNTTATTLKTNQTSNITVNLPSTAGTLALVSQIPTNTSYVDLVSPQTIGGIKTFTDSPIFNGPTNQTFPTYIPVGIHNTNKDLQAITNMASIDTSQTFLNKTISNLTAIGTTQSLLSGKQITNYVTLITTNNTPTTIFTQPMTSGETLTLEVDLSCLCTASTGVNLDKARGFSAVYMIKRTSLGVMGSFTISSNIAGDGGGGFAPTLAITLSPGVFNVVLTGSTGDTINYGGTMCLNYR